MRSEDVDNTREFIVTASNARLGYDGGHIRQGSRTESRSDVPATLTNVRPILPTTHTGLTVSRKAQMLSAALQASVHL